MYPEAEAYIEKTLQVGVVEADLSPHEVIDYMAIEDSGKWSVGQWARIRGVKPSTIEKNIRAAREVFENA